MVRYVAVRWIRPATVALIAAVITGVLIFSIGHLLLHFYDHSITNEPDRKELWVGLILTVGILAVASFLATRPQGSLRAAPTVAWRNPKSTGSHENSAPVALPQTLSPDADGRTGPEIAGITDCGRT